MFRIVSKRELALYAAQMQDFKTTIAELQSQVKHERLRAEGAINALLIRTQKIALTPETATNPMTEEQEENYKSKLMNIFGDEYEEDNFIERVQADGTK